VSKEDPKHGRWILPLVIAGLVGLTYSFVNALPPAEVPLGTTTLVASTSTLPPQTTTTTLAQDIQDFLALLVRYETTATDIETAINETNDAWERKDITFSEVLNQFTDQQVEAQTLSDSVANTNPPAAYVDVWPAAVTAAAGLPTGVDAIIEGLRAPDNGSLRRAAVITYTDLTADFIKALNEVRAATPQ
jgi:hypothetical protein